MYLRYNIPYLHIKNKTNLCFSQKSAIFSSECFEHFA